MPSGWRGIITGRVPMLESLTTAVSSETTIWGALPDLSGVDRFPTTSLIDFCSLPTPVDHPNIVIQYGCNDRDHIRLHNSGAHAL